VGEWRRSTWAQIRVCEVTEKAVQKRLTVNPKETMLVGCVAVRCFGERHHAVLDQPQDPQP